MSSVSDQCLYHRDRATFDLLQRDLQTLKWLPRRCIHRLAMAVCSCRKHKGPLPSRDEFLELWSQFQETIHTWDLDHHASPLTQSIVTNLVNSASHTDYSYCQFMKVLVNAKNDDFTLLTKAATSTNVAQTERERQKEINRKRKLTPAQALKIAQKKKRKLQSAVLSLAMYPGNVRRLESVLGGNLLTIAKQNNAYVQLQHDANTAHMALNHNSRPQTLIKIWGTPENIKTLGDRLSECARKAQQQMDENRRERQKRKYFKYDIYDDNVNEDFFDGIDFVKEGLLDDFTLKTHKEKCKSHTQKVKAVSSVLDGGHCYQCAKPYSGLKDTSPCTYHAGYVISQANKSCWSCCQFEVLDFANTYTQHTANGCVKSPVHKWRRHAKAAGKDFDSNENKWSTIKNNFFV